ncbi:MAG: hypothetical protein QOF02_2961 [Blastocatellia bacterium]|jgi:hypothetical protein|nr:hypothetical protein [Blastocatellia bacterium]
MFEELNLRMKISPTRLPLLLCILFAALLSAQAQTPAQTPSATRPRTVTGAQAPSQSSVPEPTPTIEPRTPAQSGTSMSPAPSGAYVSPAPQTFPAPATVLPPPMPLKPLAHQLPMSKIKTRLAEAQRLFKSRATPSAMTPASLQTVTLAVLDPDSSQILQLPFPKEIFLRKNSEAALPSVTGSMLNARIVRANGVNTAVIVSDNTGRQLVPLVVEYPIERNGYFREMAYYTSVHPALLSPEVVRAGESYVRTMIDLAAKRLRDKGVEIQPALVDMAERLCIVEHVDHMRFRQENRRSLYEEIFALYALNELDTYRYSVSTAGAGGMVQMIPATYQMIRREHPGIGLNPDFVNGMRNHGNALEAMLLYIKDTWSLLATNEEVIEALKNGTATQPELLAAGYNSNPARLPLYLRRGGSGWRVLIPRETQMYLQIYASLDSLIPMKRRAA